MQKRILASLLALVMVLALLPFGVWAESTAESPAELVIGENTATVAAGDADGNTYYFVAEEDGVLSMLMPGGNWKYSVTYNDTVLGTYYSDDETAKDVYTLTLAQGDVVYVTVSTYDPGDTANAPAGDVTFTATFPYALGTYENPQPLKLGSNMAQIEEGSMGYYYNWTAEDTGVLTITMPEDTGWYYSISNISTDTYGDYYYSGDVSNTVVTEVSAGDLIELIVCTYDAEDPYVAPAGMLTVEAIFNYPQGSVNNPVFLDGSKVTVTIPAGKTLYYKGNFGGKLMSAEGAGVTVEHNGQFYTLTEEATVFECYQESQNNPSLFLLSNPTEADVAVTLEVNAYEGTLENPATLVMGENTAVIAEGNDQGYYFTWIAEEDGTLYLAMPAGDWQYVVNNLSTGAYGNNRTSEEGAEANPALIQVTQGDELQIVVNSYDPADPNHYPAATLKIQAVMNCQHTYEKVENSDGTQSYVCSVCGTQKPNTVTVYLINSDQWEIVQAYTWNAAGNSNASWPGQVMTKTDLTVNGYAVYSYTCSADYENIIFNNNRGSQTSDLVLQAGQYFNLSDRTWYESLDAVPEQDPLATNVYLVGQFNNWDGKANEFKRAAAGNLTGSVAVELAANTTYEFKIVISGNWLSNSTAITTTVEDLFFSGSVSENATITTGEAGIYVFTWDVQGQTLSVTYPDAHEHSYSYADNGDGTHAASCVCGESRNEEHTYTDGVCTCGAKEVADETFSGSGTVSESSFVAVEYTPATNGTLTVELTSTVGHKICVLLDDESSVGLPNSVNSSKATSATYTYDLTAGVHYTIKIWGIKNWSEAAATITYTATFTPTEDEGEVQKAEYEIDYENLLVTGNNSLILLESAVTTIYIFEPTEYGIYTFTAPADAILGYWGAGEWLLFDPGSTTNTYEWTCSAVGQSAFIGVSGVEGTFNLNVAKTGEYTPVVYTEVVYENKATLSAFTLSDCAVLGDYVDVTAEHSAVLGEDGYYHLDSADGPILLMDLNYNKIVLSDKLRSDIPTMYLYTKEQLEDGSYIKYDIKYALAAIDEKSALYNAEYDMVAYEDVMSEDGYYPLTEDLILFYMDYATAQGVWSFYLTDLQYNENSAWMYCCRTMTLEHTYENGVCTGCGEADPDAGELIQWVGTQLQATSNLDMQFALRASDLGGTTGNYIVLTRTYADGREPDVVTIPQEKWTTSGSFYIVAYSGLAAKEMGDVISAVAYDAKGNVISETRSESIVTYALSMLGKITNAEQKTMFVDLLNYGAEAQTFFHYDEENLANAGLTEAQKALGTQGDIEVADHRVKGANFFGSNLSLENVILLQMAFKVTPAEGMYAMVTYTNHNGKEVEEKLEIIDNNGYSMVSINSLAIADYRTLVTCTLYDADGNVVGSAVDSMESYVARSQTDLGKAIMRFGASAYAYFH